MRRIALVMALAAAGCPDGNDPPVFQPWTLEDPAPNGWQFLTPEFDVPQGVEMQLCYFIAVPDVNGDGSDVWVDHVKTAINPGSHHMNVFRVKTVVALDGQPGDVVEDGECFKSANWADWPLVANSQNSNAEDPYTDWVLPANVAHRFTPGEKLMVQVHFVNASSQETPFKARAGMNLYEADDVAPVELGTLFATQQSIRICRSAPEPSYSGTCSFPAGSDVTVVATNGHFHSRGTQFDVFEWDGSSLTPPPEADRFYRSTTWDDPPMAMGLEVPIAAGGGIWWTCDYQWFEPEDPFSCADLDARDPEMANDCCYAFGPTVETSEHCNVFLYYYPKVDQTDIFCN